MSGNQPAGRRRRTTRGGRRRSLRPPASNAEPVDVEQAGDAEPEAPIDAVEAQDEAGEDAADARDTGEWGDASRQAAAGELNEPVAAETAATDFEDFAAGGASPQPAAAPELDVEITTDEGPAIPAPAAMSEGQGALDDERTNPRIQVTEALRAAARAATEPEEERTNPKIEIASLKVSPSVVMTAPVVMIVPARIISDVPPPPVEIEEVPVSLPAPPPPPSRAASTPPKPPEAPAARVPSAPEVSPPTGEPPAALARDPKEDSGLQLMEVDVADVDEAQAPATPPPPPPTEARPKAAPPVAPPAAPKRPPPPPGPPKTEDEQKKRKQVRQWWERFFSEDYLLTMLPPSRAQVARQVDFVEASLGLASGATVLDVGCGLGLHAIELTRRGYLVVGLDLSLAMITRAAEAAQAQGLKVNFVHADIREMEFDGAFDAVICMGTTFGFFDEEANRDVLTRLHHALRPGGRLLLDVANRDHLLAAQPNLVWFEGDGCVCMEESDFNYFNSRLTVKRTMMRDDGRQTQAEYSVRVYSLHELGQLLHQSGFRVIEVSGQEAVRGAFFGANAPRIVLMAERKAAGSRPSVVMGDQGMRASTFGLAPERASAEAQRAPVPSERASAEVPKPPPRRD